MQEIEAITFDLDETLLAYQEPTEVLLARSFERVDCQPFFELEDYLARFDTYINRVDTLEDLRKLCFADLAREQGTDPALGRRVAEVYSSLQDPSDVELYADVPRILDACTHTCSVGLITNGPRTMQREKLKVTAMTDRFDICVFAGDGMPAKPNPKPFEYALEELGVAPERAIHVGDSYEADVRGASRVGMHAVWVSHGRQREAKETVDQIESIDQLLDLPKIAHLAAD